MSAGKFRPEILRNCVNRRLGFPLDWGMRLDAAFLIMLALRSFADDLDDRLRIAQALLESEEAATRDKGEAELAAIAAEAGARLKPLMEHSDPEVRTRVLRVMEMGLIIPEDGKTATLRELFLVLEKRGVPDDARRKVVEDIFALHPSTAAFIARELREGSVTWEAGETLVVPPGRLSVKFNVENTGETAAWLRPERWYAFPSFKRYGERPGHGSFMSGAAGGLVVLGRRNESAEKTMFFALASMVRIPPGGRYLLGSHASEQPRCGIFEARMQAMGYDQKSLEVTVSGATLALPESMAQGTSSLVRCVVGESAGKRFSASTWEADGEIGLEMKAREDVPATKLEAFDPFWWVALDAKGAFLESGAFVSDASDLAAWTKDEVRRVRMRGCAPAGTKTLWLGFSAETEDCVPPPIEMK